MLKLLNYGTYSSVFNVVFATIDDFQGECDSRIKTET